MLPLARRLLTTPLLVLLVLRLWLLPARTAGAVWLPLRAALLIDERDGRTEAQARGLTVIGAVGVLERAADAGLIPDLAAVHATIRTLNFHVADAILNASLARHLANKAKAGGGTP